MGELNKNITQTKKAVSSPHHFSTNDDRFEEADHAMKDAYEPNQIPIQRNRASSAPEEEHIEMQPAPPQQYYGQALQSYSPQIIQQQQPYQPQYPQQHQYIQAYP